MGVSNGRRPAVARPADLAGQRPRHFSGSRSFVSTDVQCAAIDLMLRKYRPGNWQDAELPESRQLAGRTVDQLQTPEAGIQTRRSVMNETERFFTTDERRWTQILRSVVLGWSSSVFICVHLWFKQ